MADYTVDCRDVFTIHKDGCAHLRIAGSERYDFASESTDRDSIERAALVAFNGGDEDESVDFDFAPCVRVSRVTNTRVSDDVSTSPEML